MLSKHRGARGAQWPRAEQRLPARADPSHQRRAAPTQHVGNEYLALAGNLVPSGTQGTERLRWHLRSFLCHSWASVTLGAAWEPWQSAGAMCQWAGSLVGDRQGFVPWAGGSSWVAFGLVEGRSLGCSQHPCLCPTWDRVRMHPTGTPDACVPWGTICVRIPRETMHACIPQGRQVLASHWGPSMHASHVDPRCLHPMEDRVCPHPTGKHACVRPTGTLEHACQVVPPQEQLCIPMPALFPQVSAFR